MSTKKTSEFFNSYAQEFNAIYGTKNTFLNNQINKIFRKSMKLRFENTIKGCFPIEGKRVLDIGCGPGHYGITLAKKGAKHITGIDFAKSMIGIAEKQAINDGVISKCSFVLGDFMTLEFEEKFDYSIIMGFMDYIKEPTKVIEKTLSITQSRAFFSFPANSGILAWQRKLRYKKRCDLYLYSARQINELFLGFAFNDIQIEKISRDYFVTVFID